MSTSSFSVADYHTEDVGDAQGPVIASVALAERQQRSIIKKNGKAVAAVVPLADLRRLEELDRQQRQSMTFRQADDRDLVDF